VHCFFFRFYFLLLYFVLHLGWVGVLMFFLLDGGMRWDGGWRLCIQYGMDCDDGLIGLQ
jgi:hypothetical protein